MEYNEKVKKYLGIVTLWSIYCLLFTLPFSKAMVECFSVIAIITWLLRKSIVIYCTKKVMPLIAAPKGVLMALISFVFFTFVSVISSDHFFLSFEAFFSKTLEYIVLFIIAIEVFDSRRKINGLFYLVLASVLLVSIDAMAQVVCGVDFIRMRGMHGLFGQDVRACFGNPNTLAAWSLLLYPILIGVLSVRNFTKNMFMRILLGVAVGLLPFCLYMTGSRAALAVFIVQIGLFLIMAYFIYGRNTITRKRMMIIAITAIVIVGVMVFLFFTLMHANIVWKDDARSTLWNEALSIINDQPFLGTGLNTYARVVNTYTHNPRGSTYPHNSYLHMTAEGGVFTLGTFLWLILSVYVYVLRSKSVLRDNVLWGFMIGITGFLMHSFFDTNLYSLQTAILFWVILGIAVAYVRVKQEEQHAERTQ